MNFIKPIFLFVIAFAMLISGCEKDDVLKPEPDLKINSVSPVTGGVGTIITITGEGFSDTMTSNTVLVNGTQAIIKSASRTKITAEVSRLSGTGPVSVIRNNHSFNGPIFEYLYNVSVQTLGGGAPGYVDGNAANSRFNKPYSVCFDPVRKLIYVADYNNHCIRSISQAGTVSTVAGNGSPGSKDGVGSESTFNNPTGVAVDADGNLYIADRGNNRIRKWTKSNGNVTTLAGSTAGYEDGPGATAKFNGPNGLTVDSYGVIYVTDGENQRIRSVRQDGTVATIAGNSAPGNKDGKGVNAQFSTPFSIFADASDDLYIADRNNNKIRKIDLSNNVTTFAGNGASGYLDAPALSAQFRQPQGVCKDAKDNMYIADSENHVIRMINTVGDVVTFAGSVAGWQDGAPETAKFNSPKSITIDDRGYIIIADTENNRIRAVLID